MDKELLERKFERMGARVKITEANGVTGNGNVTLDIRRDRKGEFFDLRVEPHVDLSVLDVRPRDRHLLLMAALPPLNRRDQPAKSKYLCGHDERSWFVAAVPERAGASNVRTAMDALKPRAVRDSEEQHRVSGRARYRRKNRAFVRQGEWFFIPTPWIRVDPKAVRHNEPLQRSGGKAHWAEFAFRVGGEPVMVNIHNHRMLSLAEYRGLLKARRIQRADFREMMQNATVYVRGRITHPDHNAITLHDWHQVSMNTENQALARRHVVFLD